MINFLSSPLWFSHFRSLPVILSSNCPSLCSLFLNSLSTYNNLLFDLPFPLISSGPPFCILLLVPIPSFFNYFTFPTFFLLFLFPSSCLITSSPPLPLLHLLLSSLLQLSSPQVQSTSWMPHQQYVMQPTVSFLNQPLLYCLGHMLSFSQWSHFLHFLALFTASF